MGLAVKGRTLTILAGPPPPQPVEPPPNGAEPTPNPAGPALDDAIEAVRKRLEPIAKEHKDYSFERAFSVVKLADVLKKDLAAHPGDPPARVQIIGHGLPGVLFLGATWTGTPSDKRGTYVLECNLNKYGVLSGGVMPKTKVWLLGCRIGVVGPIKSLGIADGPALLFALHRMWGAEVSAPYHMVTPEDFSKNGIYKFPKCLVTARGLRVDDAKAAPPADREPQGVATFLRR